MSKVVNEARQQLIAAINAAKPGLKEFKIEVPADRSNGDFSANVAMVNAKQFSMAPRALAEEIIGNLNLENTYFSKVEVAGPGFMNFFLDDSYYADSEHQGKEQIYLSGYQRH